MGNHHSIINSGSSSQPNKYPKFHEFHNSWKLLLNCLRLFSHWGKKKQHFLDWLHQSKTATDTKKKYNNERLTINTFCMWNYARNMHRAKINFSSFLRIKSPHVTTNLLLSPIHIQEYLSLSLFSRKTQWTRRMKSELTDASNV